MLHGLARTDIGTVFADLPGREKPGEVVVIGGGVINERLCTPSGRSLTVAQTVRPSISFSTGFPDSEPGFPPRFWLARNQG